MVLTVHDIDQTVAFYSTVLGMTPVGFGNGRTALQFGEQKINLHQTGREFEPKAKQPTPGSADLCFITPLPLQQALRHVEAQGITIIDGPVERTGARGPLLSFYFRDPSGNLIEVANEIEEP